MQKAASSNPTLMGVALPSHQGRPCPDSRQKWEGCDRKGTCQINMRNIFRFGDP
ncbi:hypothetical protein EXN66_Car012745 [Channa argus]|uniref:Uncharacterized protein n=1 Tax=Channa argus TaxID=215402 RepID=A0A6G1Q3F8_CHAAH|nr:hypothetical protein EXN66_Car012745 [Channa argus]